MAQGKRPLLDIGGQRFGRLGRLPYDEAPAELKPALLAIAKLEHAARERRKDKGSHVSD